MEHAGRIKGNVKQAANQLAVDKHNTEILVFSYTLNAYGEIRTIQIPKQLQNMTEVTAVDKDDEFNYFYMILPVRMSEK